MEQNSIIKTQKKSSEMRNVTLSSTTKEFLVAHRMTQEVGDNVLEQMFKFWGDSNETAIEKDMDPLWTAIGKVQDEIIRLMSNVIHENLMRVGVTEI